MSVKTRWDPATRQPKTGPRSRYIRTLRGSTIRKESRRTAMRKYHQYHREQG